MILFGSREKSLRGDGTGWLPGADSELEMLAGRRFIKSILGTIVYVRVREGKEKGKELAEGETEL